MHALWVYLTTLPFGYWLVARYYPDGRMSWRDFVALGLLVVIWPLTGLVILLVKIDRY